MDYQEAIEQQKRAMRGLLLLEERGPARPIIGFYYETANGSFVRVLRERSGEQIQTTMTMPHVDIEGEEWKYRKSDAFEVVVINGGHGRRDTRGTISGETYVVDKYGAFLGSLNFECLGMSLLHPVVLSVEHAPRPDETNIDPRG